MNARRRKVIYFTIVDLGVATNGGALCCRNHLERIHADPDLDCFAALAGQASSEAGNLAYLRGKGIDGAFIAYEDRVRTPTGASVAADVPWVTKTWPFCNEVDAIEQKHVDSRLQELIAERKPDVVIVDYLLSALFCPTLYGSGQNVVTITLNREVEFFRELVALGLTFYGRPRSRIAEWRLRLFETRTYFRSRAVVVIGMHDRPRQVVGRPVTYWVPPFLDEQQETWRSSERASLIYVGNVGHYPNRRAVDWIATKLAPELAAIDPTLTIRILGADAGSAPPEWRAANVEFLGTADASAVRSLFLGGAILLAPIDNDFGAKFKIAEAISYGVPFLPTESAMSGVSWLPWLPRIRIDRPREAAEMAFRLAGDPAGLAEISRRIRDDSAAFAQSQAGRWGAIVEAAVPERAAARETQAATRSLP